MIKRMLTPLEKVSNVELFYDLIFVYLISTVEGLLHNPVGGFFAPSAFISFTVLLSTVLQVWFHTTILLNRYGDDSFLDNACMFFNMFALYFMGAAIGEVRREAFLTFAISWAAILANLLLHWWLKSRIYKNLDIDDHAIIRRSMVTLAIQLVLVLAALLAPAEAGEWISAAAMLAGFSFWMLGGTYGRKPANFEHLAERCSLLVIVTFGETVVGITAYMEHITVRDLPYPALVFALVVGLFLVYVFEYDRMLDFTVPRRGTRFMAVHAWIVIILANLTVALEYMADFSVTFLPKSVYLMVCLVLYLLTLLFLTPYHKEQFAVTGSFPAVRVTVCVVLALIALLSDFDVTTTLVADTLCVWFALAHEATLFVFRTRLADVGPTYREAMASVSTEPDDDWGHDDKEGH